MNRFVISLVISVVMFLSNAHSQIVWQKHTENPVLPAWSGDVDDPSAYKYVFAPSVIYDSTSGLFKMWFASVAYGFGTSWNISYATSANGKDWFVFAKNPVLRNGAPGSFDSDWAVDPCVVLDGTEYKCYYTGYNGSIWQTGLATSTDGIHWTKYSGNPILRVAPGTWEPINCNAPEVIYNGSTYTMFYAGGNGSAHSVGLATSTDGTHWTKYESNPVFLPGVPNSWDQLSVVASSVVVRNNLLYLFYMGGLPANAIGLATSPDGITWTRNPSNPVFLPGPTSGWEEKILYNSVIIKDNLFQQWYSGYNTNNNQYQIGFATSNITVSVTSPNEVVPTKFALHSAYPNPFNPATTINYEVAELGHITIAIFDVIGREITWLVNEVKRPGKYSVSWDASNVASGVYWYRMVAGDFADKKKMVLTK